MYLDFTFLECLCLFHIKIVSPKKIPLLPNRILLVTFTYICTDHSPKLFPLMVLANSQTYRIRLHNSLCLNWLILIWIAAFYNVPFSVICVYIRSQGIVFFIKLSFLSKTCVYGGGTCIKFYRYIAFRLTPMDLLLFTQKERSNIYKFVTLFIHKKGKLNQKVGQSHLYIDHRADDTMPQ